MIDYAIHNAPIGTCATQHLVDTDDMEGVGADTEMEGVLAGGLGHILVGANTCGFESFRRKLFILVRDEMAAEGEFVNVGTLASQIEDTNLSKNDE